MTTSYVDLGFFGAPYFRDVNSVQNLTIEQAFATEWRSRIATALSDTTSWGVSEVGTWSAGGGHVGYGIRIEHRVASVASGYAWLLTWSGMSSGNFHGECRDIFGSSTAANYFEDPVATTTDAFIGLHMITDSTVSDYDWGVVSPFDAPTSNPDSAAASFFPANELKGSIHSLDTDGAGSSASSQKVLLLFNPDKPFLGLFTSSEASSTVYFCYAGELLTNSYSPDTNQACLFKHGYTGDMSTPAGIFQIDAFDAAGTPRTDWTYDTVDNITILNAQSANYNYNRVPIHVYRSGYVKGILDRELFFQAGGNDRYQGLRITTTEGCSLKMQQQLLFPWVPDLPAFPFDFPLNPTLLPR